MTFITNPVRQTQEVSHISVKPAPLFDVGPLDHTDWAAFRDAALEFPQLRCIEVKYWNDDRCRRFKQDLGDVLLPLSQAGKLRIIDVCEEIRQDASHEIDRMFAQSQLAQDEKMAIADKLAAIFGY